MGWTERKHGVRTNDGRDSVVGPSDLMLGWMRFCGRIYRFGVGLDEWSNWKEGPCRRVKGRSDVRDAMSTLIEELSGRDLQEKALLQEMESEDWGKATRLGGGKTESCSSMKSGWEDGKSGGNMLRGENGRWEAVCPWCCLGLQLSTIYGN